MKIFESKDGGLFFGKINFVDDNNNFVGYDYSSQCCENFGYLFTRGIPHSFTNVISVEIPDNNHYVFDTTFFEENTIDSNILLDGGGSASFKLVNERDKNDVVILTLYNCQNGYYSHGFEMRAGDLMIRKGSL